MRLNVSPLCRVVQIVNGFYAAGGCVHIKGSSPTFTNVLMRDCAASVFALLSLAPAGGGGGAVMVYGAGAAPMFQRCSFWNCTTASLYGGGAIRIQTSATPTFEDCDFVGGASQGGGGAASVSGHLDSAGATFRNCSFLENRGLSGESGGALKVEGTGDTLVVNGTFIGNSAESVRLPMAVCDRCRAWSSHVPPVHRRCGSSCALRPAP